MASPNRPESRDATFSSPVTSPSTGYPFPDVSQRPYRGPRGDLRRGSTASSVASIGGALDGGGFHHAAIHETAPNAISTLLQHPIARTGLPANTTVPTSGYKPPTQRDIPPVALTNIPHIDPQSFHPYLAQVGSLYEAFQRAKAEGEGEASLFHRDKKDTRNEEGDALVTKRGPGPGHSRSGSLSSVASLPLETPQPRRKPSGQRRQAVTPLSTIPSVYSEEDFHLENPRTFDIVSEHSEIVRDPSGAPSGRKSLATNAILQEKLSWYMDTVEVHLISSISSASKSFFSALGSLRELHGEATDSVKRIQRLRKALAKLDQDMAVDGLKVVNLKRRRDNVRQLAETILQLEDIVQAVQCCEQLVSAGDIDQSLDDLDRVEALIAGKDGSPSPPRYQLRDLRGIHALEGAFDDLTQLRYRAGRGYESRFHGSLLSDIRRHVEHTETAATLQRWGVAYTRPKPGQRRAPSSFPGYMDVGPELRRELEAEINGLSRAKYTTPAATTFRTMVLREMKNMIRKQLPSSNDDDNMSTISASTVGGRSMTQQEKSSILARNLRALDADDWYHTLATIYTNISEGLRRLSVQVKILLDITSNLPDALVKSPPKSPDPVSLDRVTSPPTGRSRAVSSVAQEMQQALDLSNLLGEGVDLVQAQVAKVVRVRSQQNSELPLADFLRYFALNRLFADECEAISGRSGTALKSVVDTQIKDFVSRFGDTQKHDVIKVMDSDRWEAKDFGDRQVEILGRVTQGSTGDAPAWTESIMIWQARTAPSIASNGTAAHGAAAPPTKVRSAVIDEQRYILPESALAMLQSIESFQHLAAGIPSMSPEIASLLLESLKLFNSRSSQLILGAGATRSAGLKNITTKHLALSSQALSFIVALIPYVREFFRRHVPSAAASQVMNEFDKVKRLFQEHQSGIHEKLVDIMSGRASMHVKSMKTIDWDEASQNTTVAVSPYMETLTKETATLQKVLAKHLPEAVVASIMVPVFSNYRDQWTAAYKDVTINSAAGKERLLADVEFFQARISKIEGAGDLGEQIVQVVQAKAIVHHGDPPPNEPTAHLVDGLPPSNGPKGARARPEADTKGDGSPA